MSFPLRISHSLSLQNLDCQWIDVTGVPDGDYTLTLTVNKARIFKESSYDNNQASLTVTIGALEPVRFFTCVYHIELVD